MAGTEQEAARRGVLLCLAVAFGVAWGVWALIALQGGLARLPIPILGALLVLAMYAPTAGTLAAWAWADRAALRLSGVQRRGPWRWLLVAYLAVPLLLLAGAALSVATGVQQVDPTFQVLRETFARQGLEPPPPPPLGLALLFALPSFLVAPLLNVLATIGEELGWRGYLFARLRPLGVRRAALLVGLVWGIWHAPLIAQGYNYPGAPALGPLLMTGLTLTYGVLLAWLRVRSGSVWPAALAHGALNAEAGTVAVFLTPADPLVGAPLGWVGLVPVALVALALLVWGRWDP